MWVYLYGFQLEDSADKARPGARKKKKFIDKKNAVKFHLVHRSQKDPLQADEDAPQRVLLPAASSDKAQQLEEQQKYGIYFDDDYDYMQHLKEVSEVTEWVPAQAASNQDEMMSEASASTRATEPRLKLPGSVFASDLERDVGVLNMAAPSSGPKLDWDADVIAALDEDFEFDDPDNMLEDDFVLKANGSGDEADMDAEDGEDGLADDFVQQAGGASGDGYMLAEYMRRNLQLKEQKGGMEGSDEEEEEGSDVDSDDVEYSGDDDFSDEEEDDEQEEKKGTYSRYSVTSSVLPRNDNLKLLDAWFDKVIEDYSEDNIGALDHEELNGRVTMDSDLMKQALDDFEKSQKKLTMRDIVDSRGIEDRPVVGEGDSGTESDTEYEWRVVDSNKPKWDCETIISTYSTTKNLPKTIYSESEKRRMEKPKVRETEGQERSLTLKDIESEMSASARADRACTFRPKGESGEERKARKKAVKAEQMERRMEKKANKMAFREEHNRQNKQKANSRANQGSKIEYR
ncbi:hypothetical protein BaRGS_00026482 [Batillaria attramentaria]|uniref:Protein LTV1 homolog n=1 Tax=Batillaria attramentaria TaxID=370345 RepID=A0ABD0K4Q7_9CAEN